MSSLKSKQMMKAVQWEGKPFQVSVNEVPIPKITNPLDAIVRLTSSAICGSDLHTYHGRIDTNAGLTFGHECIGIVEEVGSDVTTIKEGDRVVVTAVIVKDLDNGEEEMIGGYGVGDYGIPTEQINGGQAQFMRIPFANSSLLVLPPGDEFELDYLLLADVWPTAWFCLESAGQVLGDVVVVFGAGPVGLLCAYSALLRGAIRVYSVDHVPARLAKAASIGAIPINFKDDDPVSQILKLEPAGVDRACDCVGFECVNANGKNVENLVLTWAVKVTGIRGGIGVIGVYVPKDLEGTDQDSKKGILKFPIAEVWVKNLSIRGGVVQIRLYQELLKKLIESGKAKPSFVFDKEFRIEDGAKAFREFSDQKIIKAWFNFERQYNGGHVHHGKEKEKDDKELESGPLRIRGKKGRGKLGVPY